VKAVVISIGGSRIVPDKVDYKFLKDLKKLILKHKNKKVVICTGGGAVARDYISALRKEGINEYAQDIMGIEATRLNARLVASFLEITNQDIPVTLPEVRDMLKSFNVVVCGGLSPGRTSDGTTASIADYINAESMINLTNVKGLYDKDPKKYKNAKFIPKISHDDFKKIMDKIPKKPGQHFVLDDLAAEIARKAKLKVIILGSLKELDKCVEGKKFTGTVIS